MQHLGSDCFSSWSLHTFYFSLYRSIKVCSNDDPTLTVTYITIRSYLVSYAYILGEIERNGRNGRNLQKLTRVTKGLCLYKKFGPIVLSYLRDSRQEFAKVGGIFPIFHAVVLLDSSN